MAEKKINPGDLLHSLTDQGDQVALKGILRNGSTTKDLHKMPMDSFDFPEFKVPGRSALPHKVDEQVAQVQKLQTEVADLRRNSSLKDSEAQRRLTDSTGKAKNEGYAQGLKEGEAKATKAFAAQITQVQSDMAATLQALNSAYGKRLQDIQSETVELALGIAKRLFCVEAENNPEHIVKVVSEAFAHLGQAESVILHVHPLDVGTAQEKQSFWQPIHSSLKSIRIESDPRVERGGCWIESTGGGTIDMRSATLMQRIEIAVREAYQHAPQSADSSNL